MSKPGSAVVTVSYGSGEVLQVFLATLREFHGDGVPVAVVDNNPDFESVEEIASRFGAIYVPLTHNPGYGAGMNAGVRALHSAMGAEDANIDTYFFCNPDLKFVSDAVEPLAEALRADGGAGSVGPKLLNTDGTVYPSARNIPSISTGVGHAIFSKVWPGNPWTRVYQQAGDYSRRRVAGSLSGAAVMVKRSVFEKIEGWDEKYFMHFEDIDLGFRIGQAGYQNIFNPGVEVEHVGAHSTKKHAAIVERAMTASAIRFMGKRYPGGWNAPLRGAIFLGLRIRGAIKLTQNRFASRAGKAA